MPRDGRLSRLLLRRPAALWCFVALATLLAAFGMTNLRYDDNYRNLFRSQAPVFRDYEEFSESFLTEEHLVTVLAEADEGVLSPVNLAAVRRMHLALQETPGVESVYSLVSARGKRRVGRYLLPIVSSDTLDAARFEEVRAELHENPLVAERILTRDERATLLLVQLDRSSVRLAEQQPVLDALQRVVHQEARGVPLRASLSGLPVIRSAIIRAAQRDQAVVGALALVVATSLAWLMLGRLVAVLIVISAPVLGIMWTLGAKGWLGEDLNVINAMLPPLLLVIGLSDATHLMFHVRRRIGSGVGPLRAAIDAVRSLGAACTMTSLTTAVGFGSLMASSDAVIRDFGKSCAVGALLTLASVLVVVPLLVRTRLGRFCVSARPSRQPTAASTWDAAFQWIRCRHRRVAIAGVALLLVMAGLSTGLGSDYQFIENLPSDAATLATHKRIDRLFGGAEPLHALVTWNADRPLAPDEFRGVINRVHAAFDECRLTALPTSLRTVLESLPGRQEDPWERVRKLRYLPAEAVRGFYRSDSGQAVVSARTPIAGSAVLVPELRDLQQRLRSVADEHDGVSIRLTGINVVSAFRSQAMIADLLRSIAAAAVIIFGLLSLSFRSLRLGLISIAPNAFPLLTVAAFLYLSGGQLQYCSVLVFTVCLGIAVDDTIHFIDRYRREGLKGRTPVEAARRTFVVVGPVLVTTTLLFAIGFGVLMASSIPTNRFFAGLSSFAVLAALLGDLVLLPALLLLFGGAPSRNVARQPNEEPRAAGQLS